MVFLKDRAVVLALATLWCALGMAVSAWSAELGRCRLLETARLAAELGEHDAAD
ncbi:MAG: hypothetical protein LAT56_16080 [Wenzhouxiangella sp.]|nr:hypothetical protein [Wenzhouxiangella sp.]